MADDAGLKSIAEPSLPVSDAFIDAFRAGSFHVFPDEMAKQIEAGYRGFAEQVVEADMGEG